MQNHSVLICVAMYVFLPPIKVSFKDLEKLKHLLLVLLCH